MPILLSDIQQIEYEPCDKTAFEKALVEGETKLFLRLKNGERAVFRLADGSDTEQMLQASPVQKDDGSIAYLKIPNPCNHKPHIAYVEACVAKLMHDLLLPKGVVIPEYEVIELPLLSPVAAQVSATPCCLVEALENFEPFGNSGDDFTADPRKIRMDRLTDNQKADRERKNGLLFSKEFAAFAVMTLFIRNNDSHQENFGSTIFGGKSILAAFDFDMAVIDFLNTHDIFGPYRAELYTKEQGYHSGDDGRLSPKHIDLSNFPVLSTDAMPDNWFSNWCSGFIEGLKATGEENERVFRAEVNQMFRDLANLNGVFFTRTFDKIFSKKVIASHPELVGLGAELADYFQTYVKELKLVIDRQLEAEKRKAARVPSLSAGCLLSSTPSDQFDTPLTNNFMFQSPEQKLRSAAGHSPDMPVEWLPPSPVDCAV